MRQTPNAGCLRRVVGWFRFSTSVGLPTCSCVLRVGSAISKRCPLAVHPMPIHQPMKRKSSFRFNTPATSSEIHNRGIPPTAVALLGFPFSPCGQPYLLCFVSAAKCFASKTGCVKNLIARVMRRLPYRAVLAGFGHTVNAPVRSKMQLHRT